MESGLAALDDWPLVTAYVRELPHPEECDVLLLLGSQELELGEHDELGRLGWSLAGFDVGYYESEWSHFSVILNEVLFGAHDTLRTFAGYLNEHLLLRTPEECRDLMRERERLASIGADVELPPPHVETVRILIRS